LEWHGSKDFPGDRSSFMNNEDDAATQCK